MRRTQIKALSALAIITLGVVLSSSRDADVDCSPKPPATCFPDDCKKCYCLGPSNTMVNAPVGPKTCNGDFNVTVSGFYWNAHEDGLEYAIRNEVIGSDGVTGNAELNNLIDSTYLSPNFKWDFGFKVGVGYTTTCDAWDFGVFWTHFKQGARGTVNADFEDNITLLPIWSAFQFPNAGNAPILFATEANTFWKLDLNMIDIEMGRNYWTSRYVALRPFVGLRVGYIDQSYDIQYRGGSWNDPGLNINVNDNICLGNDYKGVGIRSGIDSTWNIGCGFGFYTNVAMSILYGRFSLDHDERLRNAVAPHGTTKILETKEHFRSSRSILDLALGIQWAAMFCDCAYGFTGSIGWEHHLFFHQNQLWRVNRLGGTNGSSLINNTGENIYSQRRGNLDTQGWTLRLACQF